MRPDRGRRGRSPVGGTRRGPILLAVAGVLIAGALADRAGAPAQPPAAPVVQPVPVAAPASALSSSWFCAGATDGGAVDAPGTVVISNLGSSPVTGQVTLVPSHGSNRSQTVQVGAFGATEVAEHVPHGSLWIGAIVDIDAGAVAVDQMIDSPQGRSAVPCATSGSSHWYFPSGMTLINASEVISLLNPYPTDSIVDISFTTDQGSEAPEDFQGLDVPADGLLNVDLRTHLRRRSAIATTVSARTGSVIAWETQWVAQPASGAVLVGSPGANNPLADPAFPVPGVSVTLGSPSAGTNWSWPDGQAGSGLDERYLIYNPGSLTAEVRLSLNLDQGAAEPFTLSIGAGQVASVISAQQARIPSGVGHSAVLVSTNGVPVVAQRVVIASRHISGLGYLAGGRLDSTEWMVPYTVGDRHHSAWLVVYNPSSTPVRATIGILAGGQEVSEPQLGPLQIGPGQRVSQALVVGRAFTSPLVVQATGPVYVESDFYGQGGNPGLSLSFAVPVSS